MGSSSTADTKGEAVNVKDTAVDAAAGVKDVAKSEASSVAQEAKYQARSLVGSDAVGVARPGQQPAVGACRRLHGWASELGSMASRSGESGQMSDLAQEVSRCVGDISH